jgi:hypothetical protein
MPWLHPCKCSLGTFPWWFEPFLLPVHTSPTSPPCTGRLRSCDKTPDALLSVPIAVMGPDGKVSIATWIDSKAMFGDLSPGAGASGRTDVADQAVRWVSP